MHDWQQTQRGSLCHLPSSDYCGDPGTHWQVGAHLPEDTSLKRQKNKEILIQVPFSPPCSPTSQPLHLQ